MKIGFATLAAAALVLGATEGRAEVVTRTPRGTYKVIPSSGMTPRLDLPPRHRILYMNGNGGTYTPGWNQDDSARNISSIPSQESTVPPWNKGAAAWQQLMDCVTLMYEPFDIEVTDVDPGDVDHIESVVGGHPGDVQMPSGVGGVSPFTDDCSIIERAIVYTFSGSYGNNIQTICEVVAQESAHAFGLDHEFLCEDPLTYLGGCGAKHFQDIDAPCGEYEPRACACGDATQNSVQSFLRFLGTSDPVPPTVTVLQPTDGATVARGFEVLAEPVDDQRIAWVELWVDGEKELTLVNPPWSFDTAIDLPYGSHTMEVRAVDKGRNSVGAQVTVSVEPECQADDDCGAGLACGDGRCAQGLGTACQEHIDCASAQCGRTIVGDLACTQSCGVGCPSGFACEDSTQLCWPAQETAGGGCSLGGGRKDALWIGILIGFVVLAARARRRR